MKFLTHLLTLLLGLKSTERLEMRSHEGGFENVYVRNNRTRQTVTMTSGGRDRRRRHFGDTVNGASLLIVLLLAASCILTDILMNKNSRRRKTKM